MIIKKKSTLCFSPYVNVGQSTEISRQHTYTTFTISYTIYNNNNNKNIVYTGWTLQQSKTAVINVYPVVIQCNTTYNLVPRVYNILSER